MKLFPRGRAQTEAGDHFLCLAGKRLEHSVRVGCVTRLSEHLAVTRDDRVDAEYGPLATVDRARLPRRVLHRIAARLLVVVGCNDLEWNSNLLEDEAAL